MYDFYIFLRKIIDLTTRYIILYIDIFGEKMIWEKQNMKVLRKQ